MGGSRTKENKNTRKGRSQGRWLGCVGFEAQASKKHRVPGLRRVLRKRDIARADGAHHVLLDGVPGGVHRLFGRREGKFSPRAPDVGGRGEHIEVDLFVAISAAQRSKSPRRSQKGQGGLTWPSGWLWLTKDA